MMERQVFALILAGAVLLFLIWLMREVRRYARHNKRHDLGRD